MSFAEGEAGHQGGGQQEGGHQDWDEKAFDMEELPPTVSCSPAIVSVLHGEAGVAATGDGDVSAGGGSDVVHCFFRLEDCWSCERELRVGSRVQINARLCPSSSRVCLSSM